ncbi:uncharacterized protein [Palaemon carinicauda]|uniref:uncharacterized protein n=1 Tax=Palaemon carinicauda TaxID=392227 RepID=UPI0035B58E81
MMTLLIQTAAVPFGFAYDMDDFGAECSTRNLVNCTEMDFSIHENEIDVSFPLPDVVTSNRPYLQPLSFKPPHTGCLSSPESQDEVRSVRNYLGNRIVLRTPSALRRYSSVSCGMEEPLTRTRFRRYLCKYVNFKETSTKSPADGGFQRTERDEGSSIQCCEIDYVSQLDFQSHNYDFTSTEAHMINTYRGVGVDLLLIAEQFERNQAKTRRKNIELPPTTLKIPTKYAKYVLMSFACLLFWRLVNKYRS